MRFKFHTTAVLLIFTSMLRPAIVVAQSPQRETLEDFLTRLTPEQKQQFDNAGKSFQANRFGDALAIFKQLLNELPGDAVLSKFASEAAINSGDQRFALILLRPITQGDPDDWQAAALLTRACAESGDTGCRDSGMAHMRDLHLRGLTPPKMQNYIVEHVKTGDNILIIRTSLEASGPPYNVYYAGYLFNGEGKLLWRITLESNDADQALFAQEHPKEASAGTRRFSLDGEDIGVNDKSTKSHVLYKFFDGEPSFDTIREEFIKIVQGRSGVGPS